jgi:3-oxoacyl-[acyl-carrier protein] reductase
MSSARRPPSARPAHRNPEQYPTEDVEYLAEAALALSYLPAEERSGLITYSMHYPYHLNIQVKSLDVKFDMPRKNLRDGRMR